MPKNNKIFEIDTKHLSKLNRDQRILEVLKSSPVAIPFNFLSAITDIPKSDLSLKINSLKKYGLIRKKTVQKAVYITLGSNKNG